MYEALRIAAGSALAYGAKDLVKEIYCDLAKPGVAQVGKAVGNLIGIVLTPLNWSHDRVQAAASANLEKYRKMLASSPEEDVIEVPPEIGVPLLEKLSYVTNDELSGMYVTLLASASVFESSSVAHPAFVNVINNLSPDEALLLRLLASFPSAMTETCLVALPFISHRVFLSSEGGYRIDRDLLTGLEFQVNLSFPKNMEMYFHNLQGLGLIRTSHDTKVLPLSRYDDIENLYSWNELQPGEHKDLQRGTIQLTPFCVMFLKACVHRKLSD